MDRGLVEKAVYQLLLALGEDPQREGLKDTPKRVAGYWEELLEGEKYTNEEIASMYGKLFSVKWPTPVHKTITGVYSHCEHHLALMYNMTVEVEYIPAKGDDGAYKVIGLSKIPRMVDLCAKRLQLQEQLTEDIAECLRLATQSQDVHVKVTADHACVSARGAKAEGPTITEIRTGSYGKL